MLMYEDAAGNRLTCLIARSDDMSPAGFRFAERDGVLNLLLARQRPRLRPQRPLSPPAAPCTRHRGPRPDLTTGRSGAPPARSRRDAAGRSEAPVRLARAEPGGLHRLEPCRDSSGSITGWILAADRDCDVPRTVDIPVSKTVSFREDPLRRNPCAISGVERENTISGNSGAALCLPGAGPRRDHASGPVGFRDHQLAGRQVPAGGGLDSDIIRTLYRVTGISGNVFQQRPEHHRCRVKSLAAVSYATPEPENLLAPHAFSRFPVAMGLPDENHGTLSYDNLLWPGGSPQTASDYPFHGGVLDIYGLLVPDRRRKGGELLEQRRVSRRRGCRTTAWRWSRPGARSIMSAASAVAASQVPVPGSLWLLAGGLVGLVAVRGVDQRLSNARKTACPGGLLDTGQRLGNLFA